MNYPEPDAAVIKAAAEKYERANAAWLATEATIEKLKMDLQNAATARRRLVEDVAAGAAEKPETLHAAAQAVQKIEAELHHHVEVLAIQDSTRTQASKGQREAHGLAQAPILHHALRELLIVGVENQDVAKQAAILAGREKTARAAILAAFGAGLKLPSALAPNSGGAWLGLQLPQSNDERALRAAFGQYALAAFGPPAGTETAIAS